MTIHSNMKDHEREAGMFEKYRETKDALETCLTQAGVETENGSVRINTMCYIDNYMHVDLSGDFHSPIHKTINAVSMALGIESIEPNQKLRFIGKSSVTCESPQNEWYIVRAGKEKRVMLRHYHFPQISPMQGMIYDINVVSFPVPGYLMRVKETNREYEERVKVIAPKPPKVTREAFLIGPKELSLCKDEEE